MSKSKFLKFDQTFDQDLSSAVLNVTTTSPGGKGFILDSIFIKFRNGAGAAVNVSETITLGLNSYKGANYDTILPNGETELVEENDFWYQPGDEMVINAGDEIDIDCTADNATGIAHVVVKTREIA